VNLEGTLDTFPLRELIDMVIYSSVTGMLQIEGPGEAGRLYFRDGLLYHVVRGATRGVGALGELFELSSGSFSFVSKAVSAEESLAGPVSAHLEQAERLGTRWRQIRRYVPTLDLFPVLIGSREAAVRRVSPYHYPLLDGIDGEASLRQLAERCGWDLIDVAEAAAQMSLDGVVDLRRGPGTAPAAPLPQIAARGEGLFDRLRTRVGLTQQPLAPDAGPPHGGETPPRANSEDLILQLLRGPS
jgi:hypothetical protein